MQALLIALALQAAPASPASAASLIGNVQTAPSSVHLTVEGTADWAHWGPNATSFDRKAGVTPQISNLTSLGGGPRGFRGDAFWPTMSWTDGTPAASNAGTSSLVYFIGIGGGYQLTVPADTTERTLRIYLGGWNSRSEVRATLSDGSASPFVSVMDGPSVVYARVLTLAYSAGAVGETLTIRHTMLDNFGNGNIALQAGTLQAESTAPNDPPTAQSDSAAVTEDTPRQITLLGSDADGQALTFAIVDDPPNGSLGSIGSVTCSGGVPNDCSANVTYTPDPNYNGPDSFTFNTNDGLVDSADATVTLTVTAVNDPPMLAPIGDRIVEEGSTLSFEVTASDPDAGDSLDLDTSALPPGAGFIGSGDGTGLFSWTPSPGAAAGSPYSVTFTATDESNVSDEETISIVVTGAGVGELTGTVSVAPPNVNLTAEGTADWAHWGPNATSFDRKAGVAAQISNLTSLGGGPRGFRGDAFWPTMRWTDGTPTASNAGTSSLVYFIGNGGGYQLTAPADTTERTLRLYLGGWNSRSEIRATLSDGSTSPFVAVVEGPSVVYPRVVTLVYTAASAGQTLTVRHTMLDNFDSGNIALQAATLVENVSLPISDDFSDGNADGWAFVNESNVAPSWFVLGGALHQGNRVESTATFDETYHLGTFAFLPEGISLADYTFSVDVTYLSPEFAEDIGIMFRYRNADNYYRFTMNSRYGFSRLEKKVNGQFTPLATDARGYFVGDTMQLIVHAQGDKLTVLRDGDPLFAVQDAAHAAGTIALYSQDRSRFDNVLIEEASPEPSVTLATPIAYSVDADSNLTASAIAVNVPAGGRVDFLLDGAGLVSDSTAPYTANFGTVSPGDHTVEAVLRDDSNVAVDRDTNEAVGVEGEYLVSMGNSNTNGIGDLFSSDNLSENGRIIANQGYQANLTDLLEDSTARPVIVFNEGIGGDESFDAAFVRVESILDRHPGSEKFLVLLGTNDSGRQIPSGSGCTGAACNGTFKGNMQALIDTLTDAGKTVYVALSLPTFGSGGVPFANPFTAARNSVFIESYNEVIANELTGHTVGPDLFSYFLGPSTNRFSLFNDVLHPNSLGHVVLAHLWHNALNPSSPIPLPFVLDDLSRSTSAPFLKQTLLETGDRYYVDAPYTLGSVPNAVRDGVWIMTANADSGSTTTNYVSFEVDRSVTVYVAYDAGASSRPSWMSMFTDTGLTIGTTDPLSPALRLFSRSFPSGPITLGGNSASGASGADSNYVAIVVPN